jgi:uncharacterized protein with HEPN domain
MAEAAEPALRSCQGRTHADVDSDDMLRFALTRAVEIIGEAANKVSIEAWTQIPGIAWPVIVGMRNHLVHANFDMDGDILWTTVAERLPSLLRELNLVLSRGRALAGWSPHCRRSGSSDSASHGATRHDWRTQKKWRTLRVRHGADYGDDEVLLII